VSPDGLFFITYTLLTTLVLDGCLLMEVIKCVAAQKDTADFILTYVDWFPLFVTAGFQWEGEAQVGPLQVWERQSQAKNVV